MTTHNTQAIQILLCEIAQDLARARQTLNATDLSFHFCPDGAWASVEHEMTEDQISRQLDNKIMQLSSSSDLAEMQEIIAEIKLLRHMKTVIRKPASCHQIIAKV